ncbi:unnamed protein product [Moneuplotes crassus]|uniref:Cyclic nucleotide-binding domain-containing protein n=1 Tax=Euplotes crassus TaxID=5936 RepID=A0AAD1XVC5_EUPCR|nr:unnamed protein product [Moneuplotes crassus]
MKLGNEIIKRKHAVKIEVKRDIAQRIKERQKIEKMTRLQRFLWEGNWFIHFWDGLICLCGVYIIILLPISAFDMIRGNWFWITFNILTELIFILDIIILYYKPMKNKYKRITFVYDILALFPQFTVLYFTPIYDDPDFEWIRIIYIIKALKSHVFFSSLDSFLKKMNRENDGDLSRVIKLFIFLLVFIQVVGCLWIYMGLNSSDSGNWIHSQGLQKEDRMRIYIFSVYYAAISITTIGYGDFSGTIHAEILYIVICIIVGSVYYSFFISIVGSVFSNRSLRANIYSTYIGYIEKMKRNYKIPDDLALQLASYYENHSKTLDLANNKKKIDIEHLMKSFPSTLQHEIRMIIYHEAIQNIEFLQDKTYEFYFQLLPLITQNKVIKQSFIYKEGQIASSVIFFQSGMALNMTTKSIIHEPCLIGDTDVIRIRKRQESIIAIEDCDTLQIERIAFNDFLKSSGQGSNKFPEAKEYILKRADEYDEYLKPFLEAKRKLKAEEKKSNVKKKIKSSMINKRIKTKIFNIFSYNKESDKKNFKRLSNRKIEEIVEIENKFPRLSTFAKGRRGSFGKKQKKFLQNKLRAKASFRQKTSIKKAERASHKMVVLAHQSTLKAFGASNAHQKLTSARQAQINHKRDEADSFVSSIITITSKKSDKNSKPNTPSQFKKTSQYEGGESEHEEKTEENKAEGSNNDNKTSQATENLSKNSKELDHLRMGESSSFLNDMEEIKEVNSVSSKSCTLISIGSSSFTIKDNSKTVALECLERIKNINMELKSKLKRGQDIANSFLDLIKEVRNQTDRVCNGTDNSQILKSNKFKVYEFCYDNMESAFKNYKKVMKMGQSLLSNQQSLEKMKYSIQLYQEIMDYDVLLNKEEEEVSQDYNQPEDSLFFKKYTNETSERNDQEEKEESEEKEEPVEKEEHKEILVLQDFESSFESNSDIGINPEFM